MRVSRGERVCVVATIASIRHTLDAPALEYVPAVQEAHVDAPASAHPGRVWCVRVSMRHTRHAGRREERQQCSHGHPPVTRVAAPPPHTITLARTSHAHARHACSMTLGERVCVLQGVRACVLWPPWPPSYGVRGKGGSAAGTLSTHLHSRCTSPMRSHSSTFPPRRRPPVGGVNLC